MPLYTLDMCPENRDESKGNSIVKLWLQFIPTTVLYNNQIRVSRVPRFMGHAEAPVKGYETKKTYPYSFPYSVSQEIGKSDAGDMLFPI
jgi:hypothetical protein